MNRCKYCGAPQTQWAFSKGTNGWTHLGCNDEFDCGSRATLYSDAPDNYTYRGPDCYKREIIDLKTVLDGKDKLLTLWTEHVDVLEKALENTSVK